MKIAWIHNYSYPNYIGGAELSDYYWIKKAKELEIDLIEVTCKSNPIYADAYILGNFSKIDKNYLAKIIQKPYICIVHGGLINKDFLEIFNQASLLVFMSPLQKEKCKNIFKNPRTIVIPPYVDVKKFRNYKKTREPNTYLYAGAIRTHKGIPEILKHAKAHPQNKYHFYGPVKKEIYLIKHIKQLKNCTYHKPVANNKLPKIMNHCENFIWIIDPKRKYFESFGRTIAEALLCNLNLVVNKKNFGVFSWDWNFKNRNEIAGEISEHYYQFWDKMLSCLQLQKQKNIK